MPDSEPTIIVSVDTHVGPRLVEDLRAYCPVKNLEEFDRFAGELHAYRSTAATRFNGDLFSGHPNFQTAGHYDSAARLRDYDYDGVAAGVIFHGSENFQPIPFVPPGLGAPPGDPELVAVGRHIYNRWLVDFVSQSPDRHIGLAYLPLAEIDAAIAELEWAHEAGLRGINFPAMRDGELAEYNKRLWEPLWSVCEERQIPLVTHVGGGSNAHYEGPEATALMQMETGGYMSRRAIWWLIFGGVFERHPGLKLVITETPGNWFSSTAAELDAIYGMYSRRPGFNQAFSEQVPRPPSEYMATNVFFGASFASPFEVEQAVVNGVASQLMWGSDYPHIEGTFVYPNGKEMPSVTRLALRNTFCNIPAGETRRMVGDNAIGVYNLDRDNLQAIAREIDAPTTDELARPIDVVPEGASLHAFRSGTGGWS
jgi:predicted TIM-barrel fold metal-dependent hydrolase